MIEISSPCKEGLNSDITKFKAINCLLAPIGLKKNGTLNGNWEYNEANKAFVRCLSALNALTLAKTHQYVKLWMKLNLKGASGMQHNDIPKVKQLIKHTTDVNLEDKYGYTALHYASRNGHLEMCKFLISNGANVNALTKSGKVSPLHRCASMGHYNIFKLLIESGASIDEKDKDKKTVLHRAVAGGHYYLVKEILKISPSLVNEVDNRGHTARELIRESKEISDLFNKLKH